MAATAATAIAALQIKDVVENKYPSGAAYAPKIPIKKQTNQSWLVNYPVASVVSIRCAHWNFATLKLIFLTWIVTWSYYVEIVTPQAGI